MQEDWTAPYSPLAKPIAGTAYDLEFFAVERAAWAVAGRERHLERVWMALRKFVNRDAPPKFFTAVAGLLPPE